MRLITPSMYGRRAVVRRILKPSNKLLVAGCGEGDNAYDVKDKGKTITCFDINKHDIAVAKKSLKQKHITPLVEDIHNTRFKKGEFDAIVCLEVLEHVGDIKHAIKELSRIVKKNGQCVFSVPSSNFSFFSDPINYVLQRLFDTYIPIGVYGFGHTKLYSLSEMKALLKPYFEIKDVYFVNRGCVGMVEHYIPSIVQPLVKGNAMNTKDVKKTEITIKDYEINPTVAKFYDFLQDMDTQFFEGQGYMNLVFDLRRT